MKFLMTAAAVAAGVVLLNNVRAAAGTGVIGQALSGAFFVRRTNAVNG